MAESPHPSPIFALTDIVDMDYYTDEPGDGWKKIECASKRAYGCGQHGKEAVEGLKLYARLGDDPLLTSSLAIRMTDAAFRRFDSELQLTCGLEDVDDHMIAAGIVQMAGEQGLTVILLTFHRPFCRDLAYYLVYDHATASLSLIQHVPDRFQAVCTTKPVVKRSGSDDFELFVMASEPSSPAPLKVVLCACTPETRANPAPDGTGPWQINKPFQIQQEEPFIADVAFSFQSKGIWADLSRGLMYCDLDTSDDDMDFGFIGLPRECLLDSEDGMVKVTRTMSCVGDSIWFVCMEPKDGLVKMWTLKGNLRQNPRCEKVDEVRVSEFWGFDGFEEARLPKAPLKYPVLMPDGALCVMLADQSKLPRRCRALYRALVEDDICIFDMRLKRLQWRGFAHNYFFTDHLIIPSDFLQSKHTSRKRKFDQHHPTVNG